MKIKFRTELNNEWEVPKGMKKTFNPSFLNNNLLQSAAYRSLPTCQVWVIVFQSTTTRLLICRRVFYS